MEREPTEAVARQMAELLDYLISYLHVLPGRIKALESSLNETDVWMTPFLALWASRPDRVG
jgi:hypothetical protein